MLTLQGLRVTQIKIQIPVYIQRWRFLWITFRNISIQILGETFSHLHLNAST